MFFLALIIVVIAALQLYSCVFNKTQELNYWLVEIGKQILILNRRLLVSVFPKSSHQHL